MLFFTSDLHFGHVNIIKYCNRPWKDVESMNEGLINNWNEVVSPEDEVYVLGDVAMGRWQDNISLVSQLNGSKFLIPGNHDRCWSGHKKPKVKEYEDVGFTIYPNFVPSRIGDEKIYVEMCHFPYTEDDRHGDAYAEHRPNDVGAWLLHGHVHDTWKVNNRQINVGTDVWDYRPVPVEEIVKIINER